MNDESFCCNGKCDQGRECPRYRQYKEDRLANIVEKLLAAVAGMIFLFILAGYLWASLGL